MLNARIRKVLILLCLVPVVASMGYAVYAYFRGPEVRIIEKPGNVKEVYIDRPVLVTKEVIKYVSDKAEVQKVLMENAYLENQVTLLNETIAKLQAAGAGTIVYVDKPGPTKIVRTAEFKDWRLHFTAVDEKAQYTLTQAFEAIATTGKTREGKPFSTVKLFEIGPNAERFPLQNTQTTVVAAAPTGAAWLIGFSVQAGAGIRLDEPGFVVGAQWLKRGYTKAAEDGVFSLLTPAVFVGSKTKEVGILPVSVNLGRIPRQPFKDLWLSPYLSQSALGVVVTATF